MLTVKHGSTAPKGFIEDVFALEQIVYTPELCGDIANMYKRYERCPDTFVLLYDGDTLAGYINALPVSDSLYDEMVNRSDNRMRDDDITPDEMTPWSTETANHVLVLSVVVRPEYQKSNAIVRLSKAFLAFLRKKNKEGCHIDSLFGYAVSLGGIKFMKRIRTSFLKKTEEGYNLFFGDEESVQELLDDGFLLNTYKKTYKDDLYFFIPMTSLRVKGSFEFLENANTRVTRDEEELDYVPTEDMSKLGFGDQLCKMLNRHVEYETNSDVFKAGQLSRFYIGNPENDNGAFYLACYDDDYDDIPLYDEPVHLFITGHRDTGLYIVTLAVMNNTYIPTQLIDQMSSGHLDISSKKGEGYVPIEEYIRDRFKLEKCGQPKCVACLSNEPEDRNELAYLLSGETYISKHIDYKIRPHLLEELLQDHSSYDYYTSYISNSVIAFVFADGYYSDVVLERLDSAASVIFVVEIVLFQNTAILRTNRKVVNELSDDGDVSQQTIDDLYMEFGKTMRFWNSDIFKYPYSQREADEVIRCFGIDKILEDYHRNQQFLDRMIELKSNIAAQDSDRVMNNILFFMSIIEGSSITVAGFAWAYALLNGGEWMAGDGGKLAWIVLFILGCLLVRFAGQWITRFKQFRKHHKKKKEKRRYDDHTEK
ncbi:MAG: hypothetical protein E7553_04415 [Ruminococcaceae bacterium]|nr:hypothetical protein [Oscillospiraceae bacterium]